MTNKIQNWENIRQKREELAVTGKTVIFTNGCFDILHRGHVEYLEAAKRLGDVLIIGLNSDDSVRRLKGTERPINREEDRAIVLSGLESVDYVVIFEEDTPFKLIKLIKPDFLVKGSDWKTEAIIGSDIVKSYGGKVIRLNFIPGYSSSYVIDKLKG